MDQIEQRISFSGVPHVIQVAKNIDIIFIFTTIPRHTPGIDLMNENNGSVWRQITMVAVNPAGLYCGAGKPLDAMGC